MIKLSPKTAPLVRLILINYLLQEAEYSADVKIGELGVKWVLTLGKSCPSDEGGVAAVTFGCQALIYVRASARPVRGCISRSHAGP